MRRLLRKRWIPLWILLVLLLNIFLCRFGAVHRPDYPQQDLTALLQQRTWNDADYKTLLLQTGLGRLALETLTDAEILQFQQQFFAAPEYETSYICFPITANEMNTVQQTRLAPLQDGDILLTFNTNTLGWRHGHAAIVTDAASGTILEHCVLGERSKFGAAKAFGRYPSFAVLRHPDQKLAQAAAAYARERLAGIAYNPLAGLWKKDKSGMEQLDTSQCAHIVWQAYKAVGADIDGNGGRLVLPGDLLKSEQLELVQLYGMDAARYS